MKFEKMFSPIQIGPMEVKNRFVVPPMGNNFANTDGTMSDQSVAYYGARAKGGFGLITLEATVVHKGAKGGPRKPCLYDDSAIPSFKKVIDACHAEGAKVSIQLQNAGPEGNAKNAGAPIQAATAVTSAEVTMIPDNYVTLTDPEDIKNLNRTLDLLDEDDDVQAVYHNRVRVAMSRFVFFMGFSFLAWVVCCYVIKIYILAVAFFIFG